MVFQTPNRRTLDEEQVSSEVLLLVVGEVLDDPLDILCCGHENIHGLKLLGLSVVGDRFNDWVQGILRSGHLSTLKDYLRVTFSSRISNCLSTEPSSFCA